MEATTIESISYVRRHSFARRRKRSKVAAKHTRTI
jgi:hypothetical protein